MLISWCVSRYCNVTLPLSYSWFNSWLTSHRTEIHVLSTVSSRECNHLKSNIYGVTHSAWRWPRVTFAVDIKNYNAWLRLDAWLNCSVAWWLTGLLSGLVEFKPTPSLEFKPIPNLLEYQQCTYHKVSAITGDQTVLGWRFQRYLAMPSFPSVWLIMCFINIILLLWAEGTKPWSWLKSAIKVLSIYIYNPQAAAIQEFGAHISHRDFG